MKTFAVVMTWLFLVTSSSFLLVLCGWLFLAAALCRYGTRRR